MKRLKRGREETERNMSRSSGGVENIFSDEDEEDDTNRPTAHHYDEDEETQYKEPVYRRRDAYDDMGDFIADEDEDDLDQVLNERRFGQRNDGAAAGYYDDRGHVQPGKGIMDMLPEGISEE